MADKREAVLLAPALGVMTSFAVTPMLSSVLYGVTTYDPLTLTLASLALGAAMVAAYVPARRAPRIDPILAFRSDQPK